MPFRYAMPFNLTVLGVALLLARARGTTWDAMGMSADRLRRGATVGNLIGIVIVGFFFAAVVFPATREAFRDDRIIEGSIGLSLYHAQIRVPIGTAVHEEVVSRSIIFGMLARRTSPLVAALWSSLLFGLWHVLPALDAVETNPVGDAFGSTWEPVVAAIVSTFLAGMVFVWIRLYSGSIIAPIIVHMATNSTAIIASAVVLHVLERSRRSRPDRRGPRRRASSRVVPGRRP
jgi:membrane protease YdiL (CAAX protease family)